MRLIVMKKFFLSALTSFVLFGASAFAMELSESEEFSSLCSAKLYSTKGQHKEAFQIYEKLVRNSFSENIVSIANNNLADLYLNGKGVPQNSRKAMEYYEASAKGGNMIGQHNWALHCYNGKHVRRDPLKALLYFGRAAEQGDEVSQASISEIIADYEKLADGGDLAAKDLLALLPTEYKQKFFVNQKYPQKEH